MDSQKWANDFFFGNAANFDHWYGGAIGTGGTLATGISGQADANHIGVVPLKSGTGADSGYYVLTNTSQFVLSGGEKTRAIFKIPASFIDAGNTLDSTLLFGFVNTTTATIGAQSALIRVKSTAGGTANLTAYTYNGANTSNSAGAGTISNLTANTWYNAVITVNSAYNSILFEITSTINSAPLWSATITTNLPTTYTGHGVKCWNSGTSSIDLLYIDYMDLEINRVLNR